ncbi:hypothetical protein CEXT_779471 [Caerostris extrusa]|uniref:Uncharacterized protein n=1 Tax=Caerostris extrusa TaxID=172846 RepID=A0AAV4Y058_CAEEX|nr:hypothetical protein CEXT_779471 [Caerostris extrusa]
MCNRVGQVWETTYIVPCFYAVLIESLPFSLIKMVRLVKFALDFIILEKDLHFLPIQNGVSNAYAWKKYALYCRCRRELSYSPVKEHWLCFLDLS